MTTLRPQPNDRAAQLWATLRLRGTKGLSAGEAAEADIASEPYARRTMHAWAAAGYLSYVAPENRRLGSGRYMMLETAPLAVPAVTTDGKVISRDPAMSASDFAAIRKRAGLSAEAFGRALGLTGMRPNVIREIRSYETDRRPVLEAMAAKVRALSERLTETPK